MAGSTWLAALAASIWLYLLLFRGRFWLVEEREDRSAPPDPQIWPAIVAVIPARDEADVLATTLLSLIDQDYPGDFRIILVDDHSSDGTADVARALAAAHQADARLETMAAAPLPPGWTGKLWAAAQGVARASQREPDYLLLTDADIAYSPGSLRRLAARARTGGFKLTSAMVKLRCESAAEKLLIPAFVFFFRMLYPFRWVNDPRSRVAAAAGGCMLIEAQALADAGGIASIRSALIDDCALGTALKKQGRIWLGLSDAIVSVRPYGAIADVGAMVTRSAYAQLRYSPLLLAGCVLGMGLVYCAPPAFALLAGGAAAWLGAMAWCAMAVAFAPMSLFYRRAPLWGFALPLIALIYLGFTIRSAIEHKLGRGGMWKGRAQAIPEA